MCGGEQPTGANAPRGKPPAMASILVVEEKSACSTIPSAGRTARPTCSIAETKAAGSACVARRAENRLLYHCCLPYPQALYQQSIYRSSILHRALFMSMAPGMPSSVRAGALYAETAHGCRSTGSITRRHGRHRDGRYLEALRLWRLHIVALWPRLPGYHSLGRHIRHMPAACNL